MNVCELVPKPEDFEIFKRNRMRYIPDKAGCYVLTTFTREVLYLGLTNNLRRRMNEHLDDPSKTGQSIKGRAIFFYWFLNEELNKIERTWQNIHIQHEGVLPEFNKIYSPIGI